MYVYVKICRNITSTGARGQVSFFNEVDMSHDDDNDETDPYQVSSDERRKCWRVGDLNDVSRPTT